VPPLLGFRIKSGLTIPAPVLILGDIVDPGRGIQPVLVHTGRAGPATATLNTVACRTERIAFIGFHRVKIRLKIPIILM
jgi:hypothetical protein